MNIPAMNKRKLDAIHTIWATFFSVTIPDWFFKWEDDRRYDFIENNVYELYSCISARDLDKNICAMINAVNDI